MMQLPEIIKQLIIINVIVFLGSNLIYPGSMELFSLHFPKNSFFFPTQLITYMFMHGNLTHQLFNMFSLFMFGGTIVSVLGERKFLFLYFSAGVGGAILHILITYFRYYSGIAELEELGMTSTELENLFETGLYRSNIAIAPQHFKTIQDIIIAFNAPLVGASAGIYGLLVAFAVSFPNALMMMLFIPYPIKAKYLIPGIIALDLFSGITGSSILSPANTAFFAHVGGALIGFIITKYWKQNGPNGPFNKFNL